MLIPIWGHSNCSDADGSCEFIRCQAGGRRKFFNDFSPACTRPCARGAADRPSRLKIATRLYKALVAKNPDRVITLRNGGGRVVARNQPQRKSGSNSNGDLPFRKAPSLVPADGYR